MKETQFLGTLLPSSPDFLPIIQELRDKHNLSEISPDDDGMKEILLSGENIDWQAIRQEGRTLFAVVSSI